MKTVLIFLLTIISPVLLAQSLDRMLPRDVLSNIQQRVMQQRIINACYMCGNIVGGYVGFVLPHTEDKLKIAKEKYNCEPINIVKCPKEVKLLGTIEELEEQKD